MRKFGMLAGAAVAALFASAASFAPLNILPRRDTGPAGALVKPSFKKRGSGLGRRNPHQNNVQNPRGTVPNRGLRRIQGRQRADRFGQ